MSTIIIPPEVIGGFVDRIANQAIEETKDTDNPVRRRTPQDVAGRFIEEAVELCLATGMNPNDIMGHVMDSIHNQVGKAGRREGRVIYPSYYTEDIVQANIAEEAADCSLVLKDLVFVAGIDLPMAEQEKWGTFTKRTFNVSEHGTLYAIKPKSD